MSEFREKAIAGVSWSVVSQLGRQGLSFVVGVVLARLLVPGDFGLVAMVTIVTGFATTFAELGFGAAIVQWQDVEQRHVSSVFWINVAAGVLLSLLFLAGAPLLGAFYGEPDVVPVAMVMASLFFIQSLGIIQTTLFSKSIDFKALAISEVVGIAVAGACAIAAALLGMGVWSLVILKVGTALVMTALLWVLSAWRPQLLFDLDAVRELFGFSANLLGERTLNYWVRHVDDLLIGRYVGEAGLGVYTMAYNIMLFPLQNVSRVIGRVMFPSLSTIQGQKERVKQVFLRMTRTIALITFPLMLGLLATVRPFVLAVFGAQWMPMIPILAILSVLGLVQSIVTLVGSLYLSQGRADLQFRIGLVIKPVLIAGIVIGLKWGIVGVAAGYAIASLIVHVPNMHYAGRLVGMRYAEVVWNVAGVFGCAALMAVLVYGLSTVLPEPWTSGAELAVLVPFGVLTYFGLLRLFRVAAFTEALELARERLALAQGRSTDSA